MAAGGSSVICHLSFNMIKVESRSFRATSIPLSRPLGVIDRMLLSAFPVVVDVDVAKNNTCICRTEEVTGTANH